MLQTAQGEKRLKICLLTFSRIQDDPRVRRQGDALAAAGHELIAIGYAGSASDAPSWPVIEVSPPHKGRLRRVLAGMRLVIARIFPATAPVVYWMANSHRKFFAAARKVGADVYHANDWNTLPIAARLAQENEARYAYDSHEYAVHQLAHRRIWRVLVPRFIREIEGKWIAGAAFVSTVGQGIAEHLQHDYSLSLQPLVIRNVPAYEAHPVRPPSELLTVLYHGAFNLNRGLEALISSVPLWDTRFQLIIRGSGTAAFEEKLRSLVDQLGIEQRVHFVDLVAVNDVVRAANAADIGIHPIPPTNIQTTYCLPNKLFEYVMARLALCVTSAPEMAGVVRRFDLGHLIDDYSPEGIAAAVNLFTHESVSYFKQQADHAARMLSWEEESGILIDAYDRLAGSTSAPKHRCGSSDA